jgi:hypothetical protein
MHTHTYVSFLFRLLVLFASRIKRLEIAFSLSLPSTFINKNSPKSSITTPKKKKTKLLHKYPKTKRTFNKLHKSVPTYRPATADIQI